MREIKFRAWNFYEKKMYRLEAIDVRFELATVTKQNSDIQDYDAYFRFSEIELMQYTGLKDQNNAEIYESYIVKFDPQSPCGDEFYNPRDGEIGEVILDFGSFVVRPIDKKREGLHFSLSELGDWVVVGNIYENKILIEAKK